MTNQKRIAMYTTRENVVIAFISTVLLEYCQVVSTITMILANQLVSVQRGLCRVAADKFGLDRRRGESVAFGRSREKNITADGFHIPLGTRNTFDWCRLVLRCPLLLTPCRRSSYRFSPCRSALPKSRQCHGTFVPRSR